MAALHETDRAFLLTEAGFSLRALGRLRAEGARPVLARYALAQSGTVVSPAANFSDGEASRARTIT